MKDDDSSSIVRSQTAHQVNVSEYTGNATTPQNHVTSDVDRELVVSESDAGPARQIATDHESVGIDTAVAASNTQGLDATPTDASESLRIEADAATPPSDPIDVPVDAFQDELAAIERARDIEHHQRVATQTASTDAPIGLAEPVPDEHHAAVPTSAEAPHIEAVPTEPPTAEHSVGEAKPAFSDGHATLPTADPAPHLEAVPTEPALSDHHVGEAKPAFGDNHALLPEQGTALQDPELDWAELGHAHPLSDPESSHSQSPAGPHAAHAHLHTPAHTPAHALSPTGAALADPNKDEFQGRIAGIKREVQALNDRLTDFEAELDKDQLRSTRP